MGGARFGEVVRLVEVTVVVGCWLVGLLGGVFSRASEGWSMVAMGGICGAEERAGGGLWSALFLLLLRKERRRMKRGLSGVSECDCSWSHGNVTYPIEDSLRPRPDPEGGGPYLFLSMPSRRGSTGAGSEPRRYRGRAVLLSDVCGRLGLPPLLSAFACSMTSIALCLLALFVRPAASSGG